MIMPCNATIKTLLHYWKTRILVLGDNRTVPLSLTKEVQPMAPCKKRNNTITMFVIWVISCLVFNAISVCRKVKLGLQVGSADTTEKPGLFVYITLFFVVAYFYPMLLIIFRKAKLAQIKWLTKVTKYLLVIFSIAVVIALISLFVLFLGKLRVT